MSRTAVGKAKRQPRSLARILNTTLVYVYFLLFLFSSTILPFYKIYNSHSAIIEFILIGLIFLLNIKRILKDRKLFILFLFTIILAVISLTITGSGIGSFLNLAKFLMGILFFSVGDFADRTYKMLICVCLIVWLRYLPLSMQIWNLYQNETSLINPNTVGILLFSTSVVIGYYFSTIKKGRWLLTAALYILTFVAIIFTQCRSAILALVIFLLLNYVPFLKVIVLRIKTLVMYLTTIAGIVFARLYANRSFGGADFISLASYSSEKGLYSGRDKLWDEMFRQLDMDGVNYLTGLGTRYGISNEEIINSFHNWYFGIMYSFGIPVCVLYFCIFIKAVDKIVNYAFLCGIIALMAMGFFEMLGQGGVQVCIFMYFIFGSKRS